MSQVTNVLLHYGLNERDDILSEVNLFFTDQRGFVDIETPEPGWYGGSKYLEVNLVVGAFDYLDLDALVEHLKALSWEEKEAVQLLVCDQDDARFRIINVLVDDGQ